MRKTVFVVVSLAVAAGGSLLHAQDAAAQAKDTPPARTFNIHFCTRDVDEFARVAQLAEKLRPHGRIDFTVSTLAEKSAYDVPEGGSPWHEYASYGPAPYKYFPPKKLAPFIPAGHVKRNRRMLDAKLKVLRGHGYGAVFEAYVPNFWPEAFFEKYPNLRGARSDHPRRSRKEAFAPCVDRPEVREMIAESMEQLVRHVPELHTYRFKTNDAGPGLCWSYWLYSGPNGPTHCRDRGMGTRVRGLLNAINEGVERGGGKVRIVFRGLFSDEEKLDIRRQLPANAHFGGLSGSAWVSTSVNTYYPVKGILDPLGMIGGLSRVGRPGVKNVMVNFRVSYDRGGELPETVEKVFWMIDDVLRNPVEPGIIARLQRLKKWCSTWGGPDHAERLFGALVELNEAFKYRRAAFPGIRSLYTSVSMRYMTRPLVAMPDKLTPDEEAYFLPHVFNPNVNEGRMDYIDFHGGRLVPTPMVPAGLDPRIGAIDRYNGRILRVAGRLESLDGAPQEAFFRGMAKSLRIHASLMRSASNFYAMQIVRDRNKDKLIGARPIVPPKVSSRTGDADLLRMNAYMRDELDNVNDLIAVLEDGGLSLVTRAGAKDREDTFLLGPDLIDQLRKKRKTMRDHWLDASRYMVTPHK